MGARFGGMVEQRREHAVAIQRDAVIRIAAGDPVDAEIRALRRNREIGRHTAMGQHELRAHLLAEKFRALMFLRGFRSDLAGAGGQVQCPRKCDAGLLQRLRRHQETRHGTAVIADRMAEEHAVFEPRAEPLRVFHRARLQAVAVVWMIERAFGVEMAGEQQVASIPAPAAGADHIEPLGDEAGFAGRKTLARHPVEHEGAQLSATADRRGNVAEIEHQLHEFLAVDGGGDGVSGGGGDVGHGLFL